MHRLRQISTTPSSRYVPIGHEQGRLSPSLESRQQCPRCGTRSRFVTDRMGGQVLCGVCGMVVEERTEEITTTSRMHDDLAAISIIKPDMGLATVIGHVSVDGSGRMISGSIRPSLERLRMWDYRSQVHRQSDRSLK